MSAEYGIFSEEGGGCIFHPCYSLEEAAAERQRLINVDGEDADDLTVRELCLDHEEQPKDGCEDCAEAEEDEDDTQDEEC